MRPRVTRDLDHGDTPRLKCGIMKNVAARLCVYATVALKIGRMAL